MAKTMSARRIVDDLKAAGVNFIAALPDSRLNKLQAKVEADPFFTLIDVVNEGEGIAICAGAWMGGKRAAMMMEDTGIYEGALALEKFGNMGEIPVLLLVGYHGPIGEGNWFQVSRAPLTESVLNVLRIPYVIVRSDEELDGVIQEVVTTMNSSKRPVAVLFGGVTT